jgi:hypothetical protein
MHQQRQSRWWPTKEPILVAIGIAIVFLVLVSSGCDSDWTGFGRSKVYGKVEPAKTLWDWLDLLIVPAVPASAGFLFIRSQNKATRTATDTRGRDEALQAYLDKMSELLIDGQLHKIADEYDKTRIAARARTLAVLSEPFKTLTRDG